MVAKRSGSALPTNAKRKKVGNYRQVYSNTIAKLLELVDEATGEKTSGPFLKLPPKKIYPDYYDIIAQPISLAEIQKKIKAGKYLNSSPDDFLDDFRLLAENAAKYNDPQSWIVAGANQMLEFVENELENPSRDEPVTNENLPEVMSDLLEEVISHEFEDGVISLPFMDNVDTNEYPDYLTYVQTPTSFNSVREQIDEGKFNVLDNVAENLALFHDATMLIFSNAHLYNDPSTEIAQDASRLQELFTEKYNALVESLPKSSTKLKLKLPKVKLNLKLKSKTKRIKEEDDDNSADEIKAESEQVILENPPKTDANTMGKSAPVLPTTDCVIQEISVSSAASIVSALNNLTKQRQHESLAAPLLRAEQLKLALFPTHPQTNAVTLLVDYRMTANGYATQSYTIVLPPDVPPFITLKVGLHNIIYNKKREDLLDGDAPGRLATDEDFQCKLLVNEEEVSNGGHCFEERRPSKKDLLGVSYDVKLNQGLNVVDFECKIAPPLSKKIKKDLAVLQETEEIAGRHTRHQLQQLKMTWDVERVTYFIVCNTI